MQAADSFGRFDLGMQRALEQAWASIRAGSLGIGAAACAADGSVLAVGRNRINETDSGDDALAGSSLAHAELNVLAKLPFRAHETVVLHTTLQPCVQCLGAIRLSSVTEVQVLAPDPLFRGIERMRDLTPFMAHRWPKIEQRPVDEWSAFALLYPSLHMRAHPSLSEPWRSSLPTVSDLVWDIRQGDRFVDAGSVVEAADAVWDDLTRCVSEVATLAADEGG